MSGHNKWSKIKYVKAKEDAKKGKVFARFAHEIMLAAKSGGGDPPPRKILNAPSKKAPGNWEELPSRRLPMKATAPQARLS